MLDTTFQYDHFDARDEKLSFQWGQDFENTNVSVYFDAYRRAEIEGNEDSKWLAQDARVSPGLGEFDGTAWDDTSWRNTNAASQYGVWHGGGSRYLRVVPDTGSCTYTGASEGNGTCVSTSSSSSSAVRAQYNTTRWMRPDLERTNLFVFINKKFFLFW